MLRLVGFRPPSTLAMEQLEDSLSGFNYSSFISKFQAKWRCVVNFFIEGLSLVTMVATFIMNQQISFQKILL